MHHSEILGKFVAIMRERLGVSLRQLPAAASEWHQDVSPVTGSPAPSPFATTLTKQLRILSQVATGCHAAAPVSSNTCDFRCHFGHAGG